ncbi:helix-turn-helix domain-containing protein [Chelativorans intermedius]|uniref:Helix-turn-helix domain-containing protein n=1 Tax=Chelativorans intermedius TaxID=515947 RepID=A0ABV6D533_9HYPH|nr:helix-turn-helix transcriptional regulator [Chelativorans intermedius]MCT8997189.1 helix-turn-helix domain-containing protein [Chelativorans intermedius]
MSDTETIYSEAPDHDTMGGRLSRARDAAGLTVAELARRLGVKASTIQAWESDRSQPRANRLAMLAGVLNVSLSWLLHGVGASPSDESRTELVQAVSANLKRLRRLHSESARIIAQIEEDLARASAAK